MQWRDDVLWLAKVRAGGVAYNALQPKGSIGQDYAAFCTLPGAKVKPKVFETKEAAMSAVELVVMKWLRAAKLQSIAD